MYEIKDANKSYTLKADDLFTLWKRAVQEGKEPVFVVTFMHRGVKATITINREM